MAVSKKVLNVLYQSNDNYAMVSGISIVSLLENNQHFDEINIYYLDYKIKKENVKRLQKIARRYSNCTLTFVNAEGYHEELQRLGVKPWHGFYITWLKMLAFGDLKINTDRLLFINGHTIINGALDGLATLDFEDNVMALSYDCLTNEHKETIGLDATDGYFNCGIMFINHKKWLKDRIGAKVTKSLSKKSDYLIADQDFCNVVFKNKIKVLDVTYNFSSAYYAYDLKRLMNVNHLRQPYFYSYEELMETYYAPKIIHSLFGATGKPWETGNEHPQRYLWRKYLNMTPWKDEPRPAARHTLVWKLYHLLPSVLYMRLYAIETRRKFAR
jgi:lipopolysaccharide biosynthesis glycosyltransferase